MEKKKWTPAVMLFSLALLVMGYPAEDAKPIEMHFRTRPMEETVVWEHF